MKPKAVWIWHAWCQSLGIFLNKLSWTDKEGRWKSVYVFVTKNIKKVVDVTGNIEEFLLGLNRR